jgi:hypothetical protein
LECSLKLPPPRDQARLTQGVVCQVEVTNHRRRISNVECSLLPFDHKLVQWELSPCLWLYCCVTFGASGLRRDYWSPLPFWEYGRFCLGTSSLFRAADWRSAFVIIDFNYLCALSYRMHIPYIGSPWKCNGRAAGRWSGISLPLSL